MCKPQGRPEGRGITRDAQHLEDTPPAAREALAVRRGAAPLSLASRIEAGWRRRAPRGSGPRPKAWPEGDAGDPPPLAIPHALNHAAQLVPRQGVVDRRGLDAGMAEELLNGGDRQAAEGATGPERVTQTLGAGLRPLDAAEAHGPLHPAIGGRAVPVPEHFLARVGEEDQELVDDPLRDRDDAEMLAAPLEGADDQRALGHLEVVDGEAQHFGDAAAGIGQHVEEGAAGQGAPAGIGQETVMLRERQVFA